MATKKVVQELISKWKYQVDAREIKKTAALVASLKKNFKDVRKTSVAFGKGEFARIRKIREGWQGLNTQVNNYRRNLNRTSRAGGGAGGGAGGRGAGTGKAGLGQSAAFLAGRVTGSTALTSALLGGPALVGGLGFGAALKAAGTRQKEQIGMAGLLGGGVRGDLRAGDMMERLNVFGAETPFQIDEIREMAGMSLASGFEMDKVIPQMRMLGDATRGNVVALRRMLLNMAEIKNAGRANLRDVRQFVIAQIPIYEGLRKTLGKNMDQIGEMISQRKIGFKEIEAALKHLTGRNGRFYKAMERQMGTFFGQLSNMGDALLVMGESVGEPFLVPFTKMVQGIKAGIAAITPSLRSFAKGVGTIVEFGQYLWQHDADFRNFFKGVAFGLGAIALAMSPMLRGFTAMYLLLEDFGVYMEGGDSMIGMFIDAFTKLGQLDWGDVGMGIWMTMMEYVKEFGDWLANTSAGKAIGKVFEKLDSVGGATSSPDITGFNIPGQASTNNSFRNNTSIYMQPQDKLQDVLQDVNAGYFDLQNRANSTMVS